MAVHLRAILCPLSVGMTVCHASYRWVDETDLRTPLAPLYVATLFEFCEAPHTNRPSLHRLARVADEGLNCAPRDTPWITLLVPEEI